MSENTEMTRRKFTAGVGSSMAFSGVLGSVFNTASDGEIDVTVFTGDGLADLISGFGFDDSYRFKPARHTADHIEYAFNDLVETFDETIDVSVSVVEREIPASEFEYGNEGTLLQDWKSYMETEIPDSELGADTNLLLTKRDTIGKRSGWRGNAYVPCSMCDGGANTASVVYGMTQFPFLALDAGEIRKEYTGWGKLGRMLIAVHEVGHTLGLGHGTGKITRTGDTRPKITPMVSAKVIDGEARRVLGLNTENISRDDLNLASDSSLFKFNF